MSAKRKCGTLSGYSGGCRCDQCRKAMRDYQRRRFRHMRGPHRTYTVRDFDPLPYEIPTARDAA